MARRGTRARKAYPFSAKARRIRYGIGAASGRARGKGIRRVSLRVAAILPIILAACSPPDYTAVRDWARTAGFAADYPPAAQAPGEHAVTRDGILAMEQALSTYLTALSTLAADGVLPYREDPFVEHAARAGRVSEDGGRAVASLGQALRRATLANAQAPQLRDTITANDAAVQALLRALSASVAALAPMEQAERRSVAETYALMRREARGAPLQVTVRDLGALLERRAAVREAARADYQRVLALIGEGHALLKARARRITREAAILEIRAAEDALRRAAAALPPA